MSALSPKAELRLRLVEILFHPARSNDQIMEWVRDFERDLFSDIDLGGVKSDTPPTAAKKKDAA